VKAWDLSANVVSAMTAHDESEKLVDRYEGNLLA
jgi:hypothetical protein